ncbi:MAG TPA: nucleotidyltransferase domain-containing protein [Elusimicrobiota bacterium]|nr:nucleotidyltransferase domain-containing protein [Elusimicrobiota bacterium]
MMTPENLAQELKNIYGDNLVSVVLFGSAATGEHVDKKSDYNVLVLLTRADLAALRLFAAPARRWVKDGNPLPLFFDERHLRRSLDAFPIEFADIRDGRRVLHGADVFVNIPINEELLRLELENELKGKLLQLKQRYLLVAGDAQGLKSLMTESLSTFLNLFRNALRLFEPVPPVQKMAALGALAKHLPLDAAVFKEIDDLRRKGKGTEAGLENIFERYVTAVEAVVEAVDKHIQSKK